ncbi:phage tail fiber protein [Hafnia paralvei ATCC 29927]|uniref:phage tail-collar fiber domain-containing protein n=1 Tax=Hafnia paralvei TaxID=546367 RepID=UPI0007F49E29|nr:phage tail protein [Hafnia paralvei]OAT39911.1 phage tail fiber protein [Hafnia paralvei ATCC 29927]
MSQTVITLAFERWKAQQAINNSAVVLDEFVLANVPNLDVESPIDRAEQLPEAKYIVHRQAVSAAGLVNENSVVYSVTMGADVGDFEFNWVGLMNKATGTLAMIVHAPLQSKIKNAEGKQGNVLTRSFLMEYNGAASETQITTPAETWQIDFTARLAGMDERQRLENVDIYGAAAFFGDGFLVTRQVSQYSITQGAGYVGGLRCKLSTTQNITVTTKPVKVWADVCWKGTLTSVWAEELKITVANTLANYVQDGVQHYVYAVASIDANGVITDLRPKGTLDGQQGNKDFLRIDKSLSEIAAKGEAAQKKAIANLGLTQTVELADGALQKDENLSDVPDKPKARKNLELGTAATSNVQKSATDGTANALMANGAWGIGTSGLIMKDSDILSPTSIGNAFFVQGGGADNHFGSYGAGVHISYGTGGGNTLRLTANLFVDASGNLSVEWLEVNRNDGAVKAKRLQKLYGPLNKPTATDISAFPVRGMIASGVNLNTLTGTKEGFYYQPMNASATAALNYPTQAAGSLCVIKNGANGNDGCIQEYRPYNSTVIFSRTYDLASNRWSGWDFSYSKNNPPPAPDLRPYITTSAADNRYIQNTQMGAEEYKDIPYPGQASLPWGACITAIVGTTKSTGSGISFHISRVYFRRLQKYIGGSWKNFA